MNKLKTVSLALLAFLLAMLAAAGPAAASGIVLTPSIQASFELTAATADTSARTRLKGQYSDLSALATLYDNHEAQIRRLHDSNTQALLVVKEKIKEIDQSTVTQLTASLNSTKQRYQPLFDQYTALNRRITLLKGLKDKTLNSVLKSQADAMKILVQLARQDIRDKEAQLKAAKNARTQKMTAARKILSGIESPQASIKSQKSVAVSLNKRISADFSEFKTAIRKQNTSLTASSLSSLLSGYREMNACKQRIIELEQKVAAVISSTGRQIAA
ncbi:hypothetical protein C2I18_13500 [Paenibacillus sp. PK3_47]|uniref:hypothetical protein n=1 Tax=Paenibacillus sp. PK3_47 TaxID=2072642 RepID=UPI00201DA327|nr:hypothetical protein [Paenibacillus sp. PK3_47]UQZ34446.1 hypothetical protein C2I18_13500 [Paenibacillus sp. PK3_47]